MMGQRRKWLCGLVAGLLSFSFCAGYAAAVPGEDEAINGAEQEHSSAIYIPLKPAFVVNYGGPGRLRFMKVDLAVRLADNQAAGSVRHHMPYIRNNLIMLFSAQTEESIGSQEGKEALRQEALREVRQVLRKEEGQEGVVDLYFNSIITQ